MEIRIIQVLPYNHAIVIAKYIKASRMLQDSLLQQALAFFAGP